jgi:hypothetical protein
VGSPPHPKPLLTVGWWRFRKWKGRENRLYRPFGARR